MYRLWAKKIKSTKTIDSLVVTNKENISQDIKREKCLKEICQKFDMSVPVWLKTHDMEFSQFKIVTFFPHDFIDEVEFDKLEIELIDDGTNKI